MCSWLHIYKIYAGVFVGNKDELVLLLALQLVFDQDYMIGIDVDGSVL